MSETQAAVSAHTAISLKQQLVEFAQTASIEITPDDAVHLPELGRVLPQGTTVYVAHTPKLTLEEVVAFSARVQAAGFRASPHVVARALQSEAQLKQALGKLARAGCDRILLVAGDYPVPAGPYPSSLEVLDSGLTIEAGITTVGVAGHPEGHPVIPDDALWAALEVKQAFAKRTGTQLQILTQFGFNSGGVIEWCRGLRQRGITLPVHAGLAGPTPLSKLIRYAMRCGIGASLRVLTAKGGGLQSLANMAKVTATPDEMLIGLVVGRHQLSAGALAQPHFFSFGGSVETGRWLSAVRQGRFTLNADGQGFTVDT